MSRDDGFAVADVSTDLLDDPKVKALWRDLGDQGRMGHALTLYTATVLASWRQGQRVTVADAAPVWLALDDALVAALMAVKLLDRTGRVPLRSWKGWFGPAWERREARREAGRAGGIKSGKARRSDAEALLPDPRTVAEPVRPSVRPSGPSVPPAREATAQSANGRRGPTRLADLVTPEALAAAGRKP